MNISSSHLHNLLLQKLRKWTSKHLKALKVTEQWDLPAEAIVGASYLQDYDDEGYVLTGDSVKVSSICVMHIIFGGRYLKCLYRSLTFKQDSRVLLRILPSQQSGTC